MSRVRAAVVVALCACAAAQSAEEEHEARAQQALADSLTDANAMMEHGSDSAKESAAQGVAQMAVETTITQPYHPTTFRNACVKAGTVERLISLIDPATGATINAQRHALSALEVLPPRTHTPHTSTLLHGLHPCRPAVHPPPARHSPAHPARRTPTHLHSARHPPCPPARRPLRRTTPRRTWTTGTRAGSARWARARRSSDCSPRRRSGCRSRRRAAWPSLPRTYGAQRWQPEPEP